MSNDAALGFEVDSSQIAAASVALDDFAAASLRADIRADKLEENAKTLGAAFSRISDGAKSAQAPVEQLGRSFGNQDQHVASFRAEVERLTMKYQPLTRATQNYQVAIGEIQSAHRLGVISYGQMTDAIEKERMAFERLKTTATTTGAAIKAANDSNVSHGARRAAGINAGYQLQDTVVSAVGGMSPATIALQQGMQLSDALASGGGGLKGIAGTAAAAFGSLISPVNLLTIGIVGLSAAAIQYFTNSSSAADKQKAKLQEQLDLIKKVADSWGEALPSVKAYADQVERAQSISDAREAVNDFAKISFEGLGKQLQSINKEFIEARRSLQGMAVDPAFVRDFGKVFGDLKVKLDNGTASLFDINQAQSVLSTALDAYGTPAVEKFGQAFQRAVLPINNAAEAVKRARSEFFQAVSGGDNVQDILSGTTFRDGGKVNQTSSFIPSNVPIPGRRPNIELEGSDDDRIRAQIANAQRIQAAELANLGAKSPTELAAAARAKEEANINPDETDDQRASRIDLAGTKARTEAEFRLKEAQQERIRSLNESVATQQSELGLIGRTSIEAAALRNQYQLIAQVRAEAARNNVPADEREIELIREKTQESIKYADALAKAKLNDDLDFQDRQFGRSPQQQQIAATLRQNGQPEDFNSPLAQRLKQQMQTQDQKQAIDQFSSNLASNLISSGGKIGKSLGETILSSLQSSTTKALANIFDQFLTQFLTGKSGGGDAGSAGVVGALGSKLIGGLGGGKGAANDNAFSAPVMPVTRGPLGDLSSYAKAIQSVESGGNYGALGPVMKSGDRAYGAYQVMGSNIPSWTKSATGTALNPQEFLSSKEAQDQVFNKYFGASVSKYGNPQDAASVWFSGRPMSAAGNRSDGFNTVPQYVSKFNNALGDDGAAGASKALDKLATSSTDASQGLGQLGTGLGSLGSKLGSTSPGAAGSSGGGLFGWLGSLFGGSSSSTAGGAGSGFALSGVKKYAGGTSYHPGGPAIVNDGGPELIDLPAGSRVHNNATLNRMLNGPGQQQQQSQQPKYEIHIHGGSGDDHIRSLVNQGVQQADMSRSDQMRRGGYGQMQTRYGNQKG